MFMDICNPSENSCFVCKIFPVLFRNVISSDFNLVIGRFYKMRFENLTFTNLKSFINTVLSFSNMMWILSWWLDST